MQTFGAWCPDLPAFGGTHCTEAIGCIPQTGTSYGPIGSLVSTSQPIGENALGMTATAGTGPANYTFVGTATSMYQLEASGDWATVRRTGSQYTVADDDRWQFVTYRDRVVATCGLSDEVQTYLLGTDTDFQDLNDVGSGTPPRAKHAAIARDFVMLGHTYDSVDGEGATRVWWSGIGDPTNWPTPGSVAAQAAQSDFRDLPGGGDVMSIIPGIGGADAIVFCKRRIWRATFVGPPVMFDFQVIDPARGLYASGAIATNGQIAIYLAEDGWYAFNGEQSTPIGANVVDRWFLSQLDDGKIFAISTALDAENKLLFVAFPATGSQGFANHVLALNWESGRFTHFVPSSEIQCMASMRSIGYTLDSLDTLGLPLDELPFSLDSRQWAGGAPYMGVINSATTLCSFAGTTLEATIEGPEQCADATSSRRTCVQGVRPYTDSSSVFCSVKTRSIQGEPYAQTPYTPIAEDGVAYRMANGRFVRACVRMAAGATWEHLQGFDIVGAAEGER